MNYRDHNIPGKHLTLPIPPELYTLDTYGLTDQWTFSNPPLLRSRKVQHSPTLLETRLSLSNQSGPYTTARRGYARISHFNHKLTGDFA